MKKIIATTLVFAGLSLLVCTVGFAAGQPMIISANVPNSSSVNVTLTQVNASNDVWIQEVEDILFGTLSFSPTNGIFTSPYYYAADCGVSGGGGWTIQHTVTGADMLGTGNNSLGDNIIVTFVRQIDSVNDVEIDKVAIRNANTTIPSTQVLPGWLRIYYGIATTTNATIGVGPITSSETARLYQGTVEITLTP